MELIRIFFLVAVVGLTGCVSTKYTYSTRTLGMISGRAGSEKPDYQKIESALGGVTSIFKLHGWWSRSATLSSHVSGGRMYHVNFDDFRMNCGCSIEIDRKRGTFRFYEWERARSGIFPATDEQRAQVRTLAHEVETYLRATLPSTYEIQFSES